MDCANNTEYPTRTSTLYYLTTYDSYTTFIPHLATVSIITTVTVPGPVLANVGKETKYKHYTISMETNYAHFDHSMQLTWLGT